MTQKILDTIRCSRCDKLVPRTRFCPHDGHQLLDEFCGTDLADGAIEIDYRLGEGGFGVVYAARSTASDRIAVKILKPEFADDPPTLERWHTEVQANFRFSHPNKPAAIQAGMDIRGGNGAFQEHHWFAMEFCAGQTLELFLEQQDGPPELALTLDIMDQVLDVISEGHRNGVVHRDIHPFNIHVEFVDGEVSVKVVDFGIAELTDVRKSRRKEVLGREEWMSPEQARGSPTDERSDVFNLGMLLYKMLTGKHPYVNADTGSYEPPAIAPEPTPPSETGSWARSKPVLRRFDRIVRRALQRRPEQRFANAGELQAKLRRALERRRTRWVVVLLLLLAAGAAYWFWLEPVF